ncbi:hypothetical protein FRC11_002895, partial [Ceratobasidium sp. 423]
MYADIMEQEVAAASHHKPEQLTSPDEQPAASDEQPSSPHQDRTPITHIMLLGPSGLLTSPLYNQWQLFNMFNDGNRQAISGGTGLCTDHFRISCKFTINGRPFRLIDSPEFHTTSLSDSEIMKKIVIYLVKPRDTGRAPPVLSGILYLHPGGNSTEDDRLKETMEALRHLVGDPWLPSVTIAIMGDVDSDSITKLQESSPFYALHSGGAKILPLSLELSKVQDILLGFEPMPPFQPRFIHQVRPSLTFWGRLDGLDIFIETVMSHRKGSSGKTGRPYRITLEESETSRQQLQTTLDQTEAELKSLRVQLEQTRSEYASLRSELQLNDNTEQSQLVQSLGDLNHTIDNFGRSVAEYMVDNVAASLDKEDPTTLDASDFAELQRQLGHQEGTSSLVASSKGEGLPIEDCIDLALRSFLCQKLCKDVFIPFHPTLATSAEPGFMASLYEEVRRQ